MGSFGNPENKFVYLTVTDRSTSEQEKLLNYLKAGWFVAVDPTGTSGAVHYILQKVEYGNGKAF